MVGQLALGKRVWGASRRIDLSLGYSGRPFLGIECKYQATRGSVEEKCVATLVDIEAWPMPGIMVWTGAGFSPSFRRWLTRTPAAVHFDKLEAWLERWKTLGK